MAAAHEARGGTSLGAASAQGGASRKDAATPVVPASGGVQPSGMAAGRDAARRTGDIAGHEVGAQLEAFTGAGRAGFLDTMTVSVWDPPHAVEVTHTGRVVRGTGRFDVVALGPERSRLVWSEHLTMPLGALGRAGWLVLRPVFGKGVERSLAHFAALVEAGELGGGAA